MQTAQSRRTNDHRIRKAILETGDRNLVVAVESEDLGPFERLLTVLVNPFEDQPEFQQHTEPPRPEQVARETFCGT